MAIGQIATALGPPLLGALGGWLGGGAERKRKKFNQAELDRLSKQIEGGVSEQDIMSTMPMMMKSMMPYINQMFGRGAAKYGSRSGAAMGAGMSAVNQAVTGPMAQQLARRPFFNMQGVRQLAGMRSSLAG